jgi:hypothetical protein
MIFRDTLLAGLETELTGTDFRVSSELPWQSGEVPLYVKNRKFIYIDREEAILTDMILTLAHDCDIYEQQVIVNAYVSVDAKNEPADTDLLVETMLKARFMVTDQIKNLCEVQTEITGDVEVIQFTYTFYQISNV